MKNPKIPNGTLLLACQLAGREQCPCRRAKAEPANTVTVANDITANTTWYKTNVYLIGRLGACAGAGDADDRSRAR